MKSVFVTWCILLGLSFASPVAGQSSEIQARAAFLKAQEHYGNGSYKEAVERLLTAKQLLKSTNPRIEYLLTKCYLQVDDVKAADASMKKYFELAAESDINYNEMLLLIDDINEMKKVAEAKEARMVSDKERWQTAVSTNTVRAFESYIAAYPDGQFVQEANQKIRSFPVEPPIELISGRAYQIVKIGDQYWMAENVIYEGSDFIHYRDRNNACPAGWRLPSSKDYEEMVKVLDPAFFAEERVINRSSGMQVFHSEIPFMHLAQTDGNGKNWQSDNLAGFNAIPTSKGGFPFKPAFAPSANYWTSNGYFSLTPSLVFNVIFYPGYSHIFQEGKMACRCVKF